jgi:hypothetical protein
MKTTGYRKRTTFILFVLLLVRFWLGQTFELSGRESYLWLLGHGANLDWGYLNTGVLVPWLNRLGTVFFGNTELGVRWIASVIYIAAGFVIFWSARRWFDPVSAFWTMVIYLVAPVYTWKLLLMNEATVSLGLMALALLAYREAVVTDKWYWYLASGVISGLAVHVSWSNLIWPLGLLLYYFIDSARRQQLRHPQHLITPVTVAILSIPIFLWYQRPEMEGIKRLHPLPLEGASHQFSLLSGFHFISEQIVWLSPAIFLGILLAFYYAGAVTFNQRRYELLLCVSLPGIALQLLASFFGAANPDLMPALYLPIIFVAGNLWVGLAEREARWRRVGVGLLILAGLQSLWGLIPSADRALNNLSGLHPAYSYRNLADEMSRRMQEKGASVAVAQDHETASALTFYLPRQQMAYVIARHGVRSQFDFWPNYNDFNGYNFILVTNQGHRAPEHFTCNFDSVDPMPDVSVAQSESMGWTFYYCQGFKSEGDPAQKSATVEEMSGANPLPK